MNHRLVVLNRYRNDCRHINSSSRGQWKFFCMGSAVAHNKGVLLPVDIAAPEDPEIAGCVYAFTSQSYMLILVSFEHKDKNMSKRRPVTATAMLC